MYLMTRRVGGEEARGSLHGDESAAPSLRCSPAGIQADLIRGGLTDLDLEARGEHPAVVPEEVDRIGGPVPVWDDHQIFAAAGRNPAAVAQQFTGPRTEIPGKAGGRPCIVGVLGLASA
jgi:hypothetical protein